MKYDPEKAPDPEAWLALDESEQLDAVLRYHKRFPVEGGSARMHAVVHSAVETQLAEGHQAARDALERLLAEGLDRHEALHAVGAVFAEQLFAVLKHKREFDADEYETGLSALTAASWREWGDDE